MLFNSLKFLVFFPPAFMLYWALPSGVDTLFRSDVGRCCAGGHLVL